MALGKFEDREERALRVRYCRHYRQQQSIGALSRLIFSGYSLFLHRYIMVMKSKIFGFFSKIFGGLYFGGGHRIANPPK